MRFTLWDNSSRWTRIFIWCQVPSENLTVCLDPNFPYSAEMHVLASVIVW